MAGLLEVTQEIQGLILFFILLLQMVVAVVVVMAVRVFQKVKVVALAAAVLEVFITVAQEILHQHPHHKETMAETQTILRQILGLEVEVVLAQPEIMELQPPEVMVV
jgi:hypothetical protein